MLLSALATAVVVALSPAAVTAPAQAASVLTYRLEVEWDAPGGDGLAVDRRNGEVYVADYADDTVRRYSRAGALIGSWPAEAPRGLAVDAAGRVLVLEHVGSLDTRVRVRSATGGLLDEYGAGHLSFGADIAVAPSGDVYVADGMYDRVVRYSSSGAKLGQWGGEGTGPGQFDYAAAIAVGPQGVVYVAERSNHRVQRFAADGTYLGAWGQVGSAPGQLRSPSGLATDAAGQVYVADPGEFGHGVNRRVQIFTATGGYVTAVGSPSTEQFSGNGPKSIDLDASGRLYAVDYRGTSRTVKVFGPAAAKVAKVASKRITLRGRVTTIEIKCPKKPAGACSGTAVLTHKGTTLATKKYTVKAGKRKAVKVKLTKKGAKILKRAKPRKITVVLDPGKGPKKVKIRR
ncbi:hypothetical protein GCM10009788_10000 [Nocardioides humi]|uniref:NHL repeat-containing protein n=1 Tax=Nocardioides humi TaxID=449461 RepID=A0ABN1ZZ46_9ACTN